ncbi:MAG: hypothetical protein GX606_06710 [Elusimicrobia bacterium]|nr:hypothetical protein [Elusimicrobiota bacterium]
MKSAFTLVEVLLIIVILSVIAGSAVPSFRRSYGRRVLSQAVDDVAYLMRYARARAVSEGVSVRLRFEDRVLRLIMVSRNDETPREGQAVGRGLRLPEVVGLDPVPEDVVFHPDGRIDEVVFAVTSSDGKYVLSTREIPGHVLVREE